MNASTTRCLFRRAMPALTVGTGALLLTACGFLPTRGSAQEARRPVLTGAAALGDWTTDAPGVRRKITVADMPAPYATPNVDNGPRVIPRPQGAAPQVPA